MNFDPTPHIERVPDYDDVDRVSSPMEVAVVYASVAVGATVLVCLIGALVMSGYRADARETLRDQEKLFGSSTRSIVMARAEAL